jgi:hypothetical protein
MSDVPSTDEEPDYEVGYRKPPKDFQFKPKNKFGKGRKAGSKGLKTIVNEALGQKVTVSSGGKTKKLTKIELTVHQLATKASKGDLKAIEKTLGLFERYGPQEDDAGPPAEKVDRDMGALRDYLATRDAIDQAAGDGAGQAS